MTSEILTVILTIPFYPFLWNLQKNTTFGDLILPGPVKKFLSYQLIPIFKQSEENQRLVMKLPFLSKFISQNI